jgi:hypothetical protein
MALTDAVCLCAHRSGSILKVCHDPDLRARLTGRNLAVEQKKAASDMERFGGLRNSSLGRRVVVNPEKDGLDLQC